MTGVSGICSRWQKAFNRLSCTNNNGVIDQSQCSDKTVVNYDEVKGWGVAFAQLMQNAVGRDLFKQYLIQEHAEENLLFWESVQAYKSLKQQSEVEEVAQEIYDQFVCTKAKTEVSLDSKCREDISKSIKQPGVALFDEAQHQAYKLMERDNYPRFRRSKIYYDFLLQQIPHETVLMWSSSFEKLLQHEAGRCLFEEYLINEKAEENLRFWLEAQEYKQISNLKQRKARAADIYNRFVNPEAKTEISIDGPTRTDITKTYEKGDVRLFETAQDHIFKLMRSDCYPRFVKSNFYKKFLSAQEEQAIEQSDENALEELP